LQLTPFAGGMNRNVHVAFIFLSTFSS